jgi:hypothetical protein
MIRESQLALPETGVSPVWGRIFYAADWVGQA